MKANKQNPTMILVTSNGRITGRLTCDQFRAYMKSSDFIGNLVIRFNEGKKRAGEPERVEQVINTK